ncbi:MAG: SRPBCC domain-containing protein [Bacteroidia bacterium]|nr:SRPBCC domain-containing protein [Bacteroidia bacterium]
MSNGFTYTKNTLIKASVNKVWAVLTDPVCIPKYYFGMEWKTNWQKGSSIIFSGDYDHQKFEDKGTILDIEKEKFILFNYFNPEWKKEDVPENYTTMRFELEPKDNETIFTVFEYGFESEDKFNTVVTKWDSLLYTVKQEAEVYK